jgi:lipopolysaccharide transport system ATP-binding protein
MSDFAIQVSNVSKKYQIGGVGSNVLREGLRSVVGNFSRNKKKEEFWALKDISFNLKQGEVLGVIGRNGAGKSTLLKVLSRITEPTNGKIEINGRVGSLLEVGTGFHPELTGRENIFLNGSILGMSRAEIKSKFNEIVDFSGVEKFIDTPVKRYSSGMYVRLAFAVAAHLEPEILIIDEVLAVGDAEFQKKCLGKMQDVAGDGRTVLFVSHNMSTVSSLCTSALYLKNGEVAYQGDIGQAIERYLNVSTSREAMLDLTNYPARQGKQELGKLTGISLSNIVDETTTSFAIGDSFKLSIDFELFLPLNNLEIGFGIIDSAGIVRQLFVGNWEGLKSQYSSGSHKVNCTVPEILLVPGNYFISCWIKEQGRGVDDQADAPIQFEVIGKDITGFNPYFERYKHGGTFQRSVWKKC